MWPLVGTAIGIGTNLIGTSMAANANNQAAQQAQAAIGQGIAGLTTTQGQVQGQLQADAAQTQPGVSQLRQVAAGSGDLTPAQQLQLADLRRNETNMIRTSAIQGSGRTAASLLRDTDNRFTLGALNDNMKRSDAAATTLAGQNASYNLAGANVTAGFGKDIANLTTQQGMVPAQKDVANGSLWGKAIGDIGSSIAKGAGMGGGTGGGGSNFWNFMDTGARGGNKGVLSATG